MSVLGEYGQLVRTLHAHGRSTPEEQLSCAQTLLAKVSEFDDNSQLLPAPLKSHYYKEIVEWIFSKGLSKHGGNGPVPAGSWNLLLRVLSDPLVGEPFPFPPLFISQIIGAIQKMQTIDSNNEDKETRITSNVMEQIAQILELLHSKYPASFRFHLEHGSLLLEASHHLLRVYSCLGQNYDAAERLALAVSLLFVNQMHAYSNERKLWDAVVMKQLKSIMEVAFGDIYDDTLVQNCRAILKKCIFTRENVLSGFASILSIEKMGQKEEVQERTHHVGKLFAILGDVAHALVESGSSQGWKSFEHMLAWMIEGYKVSLELFTLQNKKDDAGSLRGENLSDRSSDLLFFFRLTDIVLTKMKRESSNSLSKSISCLGHLVSCMKRLDLYHPSKDRKGLFKMKLKGMLDTFIRIGILASDKDTVTVVVDAVLNVSQVEHMLLDSVLEDFLYLLHKVYETSLLESERRIFTGNALSTLISEHALYRRLDILLTSIFNLSDEKCFCTIVEIFHLDICVETMQSAMGKIPCGQTVVFINILKEAALTVANNDDFQGLVAKYDSLCRMIGSIGQMLGTSVPVDLTNANAVAHGMEDLIQILALALSKPLQEKTCLKYASCLELYTVCLTLHSYCCEIMPSLEPLRKQATRKPINTALDMGNDVEGIFAPIFEVGTNEKINIKNIYTFMRTKFQDTDDKDAVLKFVFAVGCLIVYRLERLFEQFQFAEHRMHTEDEWYPKESIVSERKELSVYMWKLLNVLGSLVYEHGIDSKMQQPYIFGGISQTSVLDAVLDNLLKSERAIKSIVDASSTKEQIKFLEAIIPHSKQKGNLLSSLDHWDVRCLIIANSVHQSKIQKVLEKCLRKATKKRKRDSNAAENNVDSFLESSKALLVSMKSSHLEEKELKPLLSRVVDAMSTAKVICALAGTQTRLADLLHDLEISNELLTKIYSDNVRDITQLDGCLLHCCSLVIHLLHVSCMLIITTNQEITVQCWRMIVESVKTLSYYVPVLNLIDSKAAVGINYFLQRLACQSSNGLQTEALQYMHDWIVTMTARCIEDKMDIEKWKDEKSKTFVKEFLHSQDMQGDASDISFVLGSLSVLQARLTSFANIVSTDSWNNFPKMEVQNGIREAVRAYTEASTMVSSPGDKLSSVVLCARLAECSATVLRILLFDSYLDEILGSSFLNHLPTEYARSVGHSFKILANGNKNLVPCALQFVGFLDALCEATAYMKPRASRNHIASIVSSLIVALSLCPADVGDNVMVRPNAPREAIFPAASGFGCWGKVRRALIKAWGTFIQHCSREEGSSVFKPLLQHLFPSRSATCSSSESSFCSLPSIEMVLRVVEENSNKVIKGMVENQVEIIVSGLLAYSQDLCSALSNKTDSQHAGQRSVAQALQETRHIFLEGSASNEDQSSLGQHVEIVYGLRNLVLTLATICRIFESVSCRPKRFKRMSGRYIRLLMNQSCLYFDCVAGCGGCVQDLNAVFMSLCQLLIGIIRHRGDSLRRSMHILGACISSAQLFVAYVLLLRSDSRISPEHWCQELGRLLEAFSSLKYSSPYCAQNLINHIMYFMCPLTEASLYHLRSSSVFLRWHDHVVSSDLSAGTLLLTSNAKLAMEPGACALYGACGGEIVQYVYAKLGGMDGSSQWRSAMAELKSTYEIGYKYIGKV